MRQVRATKRPYIYYENSEKDCNSNCIYNTDEATEKEFRIVFRTFKNSQDKWITRHLSQMFSSNGLQIVIIVRKCNNRPYTPDNPTRDIGTKFLHSRARAYQSKMRILRSNKNIHFIYSVQFCAAQIILTAIDSNLLVVWSVSGLKAYLYF